MNFLKSEKSEYQMNQGEHHWFIGFSLQISRKTIMVNTMNTYIYNSRRNRLIFRAETVL